MEITLAKTAGFCFGVQRAIETVYQNVNEAGQKIVTLGPIIHNQQVVDDLEQKGVQAVQHINEVKESEKVIIRTHGVSKEIHCMIDDKKLSFVDATCPFVKKIHKIVEKYYENGYKIIIVGDPDHPEVIGINGWCCNSAFIANSLDDMKNISLFDDKTCVVAQTTFKRPEWEKITQYIKENCNQVEIFDTICSATNERQEEAERISKIVDIMIVIGGKHSSNTQKLAQICKQHCVHTYHIEMFEDLPKSLDFKSKKIGITAGASTPAWIIKEVINKMSENEMVQGNNSEMSFAELYENSLITLNTGDIVKGTVIGVAPNEVYVDLGSKSDGVIPIHELTNDPTARPEDLVKVGEEIDVFIVRVNDVEGTVLLSKKKIDSIKGWETIEEAFENGTVLQGKVVEIVNGGVIVLISGMRVFVPASQASDRYTADLSVIMHKNVSLKIIDVNKKKRRIVGSIRTVLEKEKEKKSEAFWSTAEVGKKYIGTVKKLADFGAFVDLGGVDGLIHISELSWGRIKHPSQVLKEGDSVEVYVLDLNKEKNKISLGYKKTEDNPWEIAKSQFNVGDVVDCKVARFVPFGAFVELIPGVDGLIHISQISNKRIGKPDEVLTIGQVVKAQIVEIDLEKQKINLSIRELLPKEEPQKEVQGEAVEAKEEEPTEYREDVKVTIGDAVSAQLKEIETTEAVEEGTEETTEETTEE